MTWVKLDDKFHDNPKQLRASDGAFRVWVCSMSYCADTPTPSGFMTTAQARGLIAKLRKSPRVIDELIAIGAWEQTDDGFLLHDFEFGVAKSSADRVRKWRDLKRQRNGVGNALQNRYSSRARDGKPVPDPVVVTPDVVTTPVPVPGNASKKATPGVRTTLADAIQNGHTDDLALQLAVRAGEVIGRDLAPFEVSMCSIYLDDFAYLSVDDIVDRMRDHMKHCAEHDPPLPLPRKLRGFHETLRLENEHRADAGHAKAWRPPPVAGDLSRLGSS